MSALSGDKIAERLNRQGDLMISPILSVDQIGEISVDVRLGNVALVVRGGGISHLEPRLYLMSESSKSNRLERDRRQKFERFDIPFDGSLILHPGTLTLVPTLEWFRLPNDLKGVVTARSSWAREGLNIATATFIDPGYAGVVTLELSNVSHIPIALHPGMRIAQMAFYDVSVKKRGLKLPRKKRQFNLSFEPHPGFLTKGDEAFIPQPLLDPADLNSKPKSSPQGDPPEVGNGKPSHSSRE